MKTVYLDLETTGFSPVDDEILEIAIIDDKGKVLVNSLIRPERSDQWPNAEAIHGITPDMVADAPALREFEISIMRALRGKRAVIYNSGFDARFLPIEEWSKSIECCMTRWARYTGTKQKLEIAAAEVGYSFVGAHRALADCRATRAVWNYLEKNSPNI
ncbi:MAG: 3'-5' exonuclease [Gammaproteobacteria bacterium]|nr:3'-5' exonuclease [Gammaproteobacteria bacterium]